MRTNSRFRLNNQAMDKAARRPRTSLAESPGAVAGRLAFLLLASSGALFLRWFDPVAVGRWLPLHTSCGAVTGLPCLFCGMTRALHCLLNGQFARALYFNWLAFPFLASLVFLAILFATELGQGRVLLRLKPVLHLTARRLLMAAALVVGLWSLQVYLAFAQHKTELLNARGVLYSLTVRWTELTAIPHPARAEELRRETRGISGERSTSLDAALGFGGSESSK